MALGSPTSTPTESSLRAIHSAIVGLTLAVLAAAYILVYEPMGFYLAVASVLALLYPVAQRAAQEYLDV